MSSRRDVAFWALLVVVGVALVLTSIPGEEDSDRSPGRSSLEVSEEGYAAWALLLDQQGIDSNQLDEAPSAADLDPSVTIVGLDLGKPIDADVEALSDFVDRGGRLIIGGQTSIQTLRAISGAELETDEVGAASDRPLVPAAEVAGVGEVAGAGPTRFTGAGTALPLYGGAESALVVGAGRGEGEVVAVADSTPFTNGELASGDNAQLAINLVGAPERSQVRFLERLAVADEDTATGLAALPSNWIAGFVGLVGAALILILSRLRRLGPPAQPRSSVAQPRIGYVDAMAHTLARSRESVEAAEPVREAALAAIGARGGASSDRAAAGDRDADMLAAEAERAGVDAEDVGALAGPLRTPNDAVKATRALGRVWRERF